MGNNILWEQHTGTPATLSACSAEKQVGFDSLDSSRWWHVTLSNEASSPKGPTTVTSFLSHKGCGEQFLRQPDKGWCRSREPPNRVKGPRALEPLMFWFKHGAHSKVGVFGKGMNVLTNQNVLLKRPWQTGWWLPSNESSPVASWRILTSLFLAGLRRSQGISNRP